MKPILFIDFDGTLCYDKFWRGLPPALYQKVQIHLFESKKELVREWMLGKHTSEEVNQLLAEELGVDYDALWSVFVNDCNSMTVDPDILNKIQELRERYYAVLITDNMDSFVRFTVPTLGLARYFDAIVNSYETKAFKNDNNGQSFKNQIEGYHSFIAGKYIA